MRLVMGYWSAPKKPLNRVLIRRNHIREVVPPLKSVRNLAKKILRRAQFRSGDARVVAGRAGPVGGTCRDYLNPVGAARARSVQST